jgi:hypothetical protein
MESWLEATPTVHYEFVGAASCRDTFFPGKQPTGEPSPKDDSIKLYF